MDSEIRLPGASRGRAFSCGLWMLVALSVVIPGCSREPAEAVIGLALSIETSMESAAVALDELSGRPEVDSVTITIRYDATDATSAGGDTADRSVKRATRMLAFPNLVGVVGHAGSRASLFAAPLYNEAEVLQIAADATSRLLNAVGPWTFMLVNDDVSQGEFIATFVARELQLTDLTVFYVADEYGLGLRDGLVESVDGAGLNLSDLVPFDDKSDFCSLVEATLETAGAPDVADIAGRDVEPGRIIKYMKPRAPSTIFLGGDGVNNMDAVREAAAPQNIDSLYRVSFWHSSVDNPVSQRFVERFGRVVGREPRPTDALIHDAIMLLATAAREVGPSRRKIRQYLEELGASRTPYPGVTGPISFTANRPLRFVMVRADGDRVVYSSRDEQGTGQ